MYYLYFFLKENIKKFDYSYDTRLYVVIFITQNTVNFSVYGYHNKYNLFKVIKILLFYENKIFNFADVNIYCIIKLIS